MDSFVIEGGNAVTDVWKDTLYVKMTIPTIVIQGPNGQLIAVDAPESNGCASRFCHREHAKGWEIITYEQKSFKRIHYTFGLESWKIMLLLWHKLSCRV